MKKYIFFVFLIINLLLTLSVNANSYYVDGTGVRMRKSANASSEILGTFTDKDSLIMLNYNAAPGDKENCIDGWAQVTYNGQNGYICKDYVREVIENSTAHDAEYTKYLKDQGFPDDYIPYLTYLHQKYGNWTFVAKKTNANFTDAVNAESECNTNLVPATDASHFKNLNCTNNYHDWVTASSATIAYYMDPRNFLNEKDIFMFENQYVNQNIAADKYEDAVADMFSGKFIYKEIPDLPTFITNAKSTEVSPIAIASRIKQEMGNGKLTSGDYKGQLYSAISGNYTDRYGKLNGIDLNHYYNFYNYGAADSCSGITECALLYAYRQKWGGTGNQYNDRQTAITGGASKIKTSYLDAGQFTAYFQKFNVAPKSESSKYIHQYMTNVRAPYSEGNIIYDAYKSLNILNSKFVFYIPVFNNMPTATALPTNESNKNYGSIGSTTDVPNTDITGINVSSAVINAGYNISGSNISKIDIKKEISSFKSSLESMGLTVTISNSSGKTVTSGSLGTGYKVTLVGATTNTYNIVVYGDASGDGKVNSLDLLKIQKYLLGEGKLSGVEKNAADASKDGKVNSLDLLKIQKYALGEGTINQ